MGGHRRGARTAAPPDPHGAARLPAGVARGSSPDAPRADSTGSRAGSAAASTSPRLLRPPAATGGGSGTGLVSARRPPGATHRTRGRSPNRGRALGTRSSRRAGRGPADDGTLSPDGPSWHATAVQAPEDPTASTRRD